MPEPQAPNNPNKMGPEKKPYQKPDIKKKGRSEDLYSGKDKIEGQKKPKLGGFDYKEAFPRSAKAVDKAAAVLVGAGAVAGAAKIGEIIAGHKGEGNSGGAETPPPPPAPPTREAPPPPGDETWRQISDTMTRHYDNGKTDEDPEVAADLVKRNQLIQYAEGLGYMDRAYGEASDKLGALIINTDSGYLKANGLTEDSETERVWRAAGRTIANVDPSRQEKQALSDLDGYSEEDRAKIARTLGGMHEAYNRSLKIRQSVALMDAEADAGLLEMDQPRYVNARRRNTLLGFGQTPSALRTFADEFAQVEKRRIDQQNLQIALAKAQAAQGNNPDNAPSSFRAHTIEDYKRTHDSPGIFTEPEGKGLHAVIPDPVVNKLSQGDFIYGEFDLFYELNKFAEGRATSQSFTFFQTLLEYPLGGKQNEAKRWGLLEFARFMNAIYLMSDSASYTNLVSTKEVKGTIDGIDPRAIAKLITFVPEMQTAFEFYYGKFSDPKLLEYQRQDPDDPDSLLVPRGILTEAELIVEETAKAKEWGCSVGIVRGVRHFVTDFGVFPQVFTETQKMVNRYPALFQKLPDPNKENERQDPPVLAPGIGFTLVEINGSRTRLMKLLAEKNYMEFMRIYSDTGANGNTDKAWSVKMWGSVHSVHNLISDPYKNALKQMRGTPGVLEWLLDKLNIQPSEINYLVAQKVITAPPYKMPLLVDMTATAEGTRTLKPNQIEFVLNYLYNLRSVDPNNPDGRVTHKNALPIVEALTSIERSIVEALKTSRVVSMEGLDGDVAELAIEDDELKQRADRLAKNLQ